MSDPITPDPHGSDEFELLSTPPTSPDISGELKARKGAGPSIVTMSLVGVVLVVGGFLGGIAVQKSNGSSAKTATATNGATAGRLRGATGGATGGQFGGARTAGGGGTVTGTVQKVEDGKIYVVDSTGKVTTVSTSDQTTITVGKPGALTDLAAGSQVTVIGTTGSDGTVTARSVLSGISGLAFGGTRGARGPSATPSGSPTG